MTLSIGSLVGYLELDDTKFQAKADKADKTLSGLELQLKALTQNKPELDLKTAAAQAKIDNLRQTLADLRVQSAAGADVRVDTVATMLKLDAVRAELRSLERDAATPTNVDLETAPAMGKLALLRAQLDDVRSKMSKAGDKAPSLLVSTALALSPMLSPITVAAAGLFGAISSGAVSAAAGVGVLKLAFNGIGSSITAYETYLTAMDKATTKAQRSAAEHALAISAYGTGSKQTQGFTQMYVDRVRPKLQHTQQVAQTAVLPGVTAGIGAALPVLGAVDGAVSKLGHSLGSMADEAGHALDSPFWKQWVGWLGKDGAKDLLLFGQIGGNFLEGIARSIERMAPEGTSLLKWLDDLSVRFNGWTGGYAFLSFMHTVDKDSTAVLGFLRSAGPVLGNLIKGFNATGVHELSVVGAVLNGMGHLPLGIFTALGQTLPLIALGMKASSIAAGAWATIQAVLDGELTVADALLGGLPILIGALAVGLVYAADHFTALKAAAATSAKWIKAELGDVTAWIREHWSPLLNTLEHPFKVAGSAILGVWRPILHFFQALPGEIRSDLARLGHLQIPGLGSMLSHLRSLGHDLHIPGFANGVSNFGGGLAVVGERGPELAVLPRHTSIVPHEQIGRFMAHRSAAAGATSRAPLRVVIDMGGGKTLNGHIDERAYVAARRAAANDRAYGY